MFKLTAWCLFLLFARAGSAQGKPQAALHRAESFVGQTGDYRMRAKVVVSTTGKPVTVQMFQISHKAPDATLVEFLEKGEEGKSILLLANALWLRLPNLSRAVQISAAQRMSGGASSLDLVRTRFELDYNATAQREVVIDGEPCTLLDLRAKQSSVAYQHVDLTVRRKEGLPVRADFYLSAGEPAKTIRYEQFERDQLGRQRLRRINIQDRFHAGSRTEIEYLDFESVKLPDSLFQPEGSKRPGK